MHCATRLLLKLGAWICAGSISIFGLKCTNMHGQHSSALSWPRFTPSACVGRPWFYRRFTTNDTVAFWTKTNTNSHVSTGDRDTHFASSVNKWDLSVTSNWPNFLKNRKLGISWMPAALHPNWWTSVKWRQQRIECLLLHIVVFFFALSVLISCSSRGMWSLIKFLWSFLPETHKWWKRNPHKRKLISQQKLHATPSKYTSLDKGIFVSKQLPFTV